MNQLEACLATYEERLGNPECFVPWGGFTGKRIVNALHKVGLHSDAPLRVAHELLIFGDFQDGSSSVGNSDDPSCVPWLVSPNAESGTFGGGRHMLVAREFIAQFCSDTQPVFKRSIQYGVETLGFYNTMVNGEHYSILPSGMKTNGISCVEDAYDAVLELSERVQRTTYAFRSTGLAWHMIQNGSETTIKQ